MIQISPIKSESELIIIRELAHQIWPIAYKEILSQTQLDYMLELIYSIEALSTQNKKGQQFFVLYDNNKPIGFLGLQLDCNEKDWMKIHKIYLLNEYQGKGLGKLMLDFAISYAQNNKQTHVFLNVNKYNKAKQFYESQGFKVINEEVIDIGNGYVMDDFVMGKKV